MKSDRPGPLRLACHSEQNSSSVNGIRFTGNPRKTVNDAGTSCPTVKPIPLIALARYIARHRPNLPPEKRSLASNLIQKIYRYDADPDAMRPKILKMIERIEGAGA